LLVDWLQLWLLVVYTPQFMMPSDQLWWRIVSVISLNQFMAARVSCHSEALPRIRRLLRIFTLLERATAHTGI
jgi:hypothetical protein